ncbi:MAG: plastocyanin/azurin family copper-binding protein [Actinomycetota bacterium]|nr:plastocyanin/azurin family copper-binding protein [Actinomycetota bacterium]
MRKTVWATALSAMLSVTGLFGSPALAAGGHTWQVQAGSLAFGATGPTGGGNRFYPAAIAIHQGDSVTFSPMGAHTITFNRPAAPVFALFGPFGDRTITSPTQRTNSGIIGQGPGTYTLTFASTLPTGRYTIICGLHIGMRETIAVLPSTEKLPKTDAEYRAIAQKEIARDLANLADIAADARDNNEDEDGNPSVLVGAGNTRVSNLRFFPGAVTVHVGQTVTFLKTQDPTEPHTVTFGTEPADPLAQQLARGGSTYSGTENISSGFMSTPAQYAFYQLAGTPLPVALTKYKVTFTKVGDFAYFCAIHDVVGMRATVHVVP